LQRCTARLRVFSTQWRGISPTAASPLNSGEAFPRSDDRDVHMDKRCVEAQHLPM
jgi:hypothetical protein